MNQTITSGRLPLDFNTRGHLFKTATTWTTVADRWYNGWVKSCGLTTEAILAVVPLPLFMKKFGSGLSHSSIWLCLQVMGGPQEEPFIPPHCQVVFFSKFQGGLTSHDVNAELKSALLSTECALQTWLAHCFFGGIHQQGKPFCPIHPPWNDVFFLWVNHCFGKFFGASHYSCTFFGSSKVKSAAYSVHGSLVPEVFPELPGK